MPTTRTTRKVLEERKTRARFRKVGPLAIRPLFIQVTSDVNSPELKYVFSLRQAQYLDGDRLKYPERNSLLGLR